MTPAGGPALAAAMRMVDRVHRNATRTDGPLSEPALAPGLAQLDVGIWSWIGDRADGRHALAAHQPQLARIQRRTMSMAADRVRPTAT